MTEASAPSIRKIWIPMFVAALALLSAVAYTSRHRLGGENFEAFGVVTLAAVVILICTVQILRMSIHMHSEVRSRVVPTTVQHRLTAWAGFAWCVVALGFGLLTVFGSPWTT